MAFLVTSADLYAFGPGESFFKDKDGNTMTAEVTLCLLATTGELARSISARAGGPPSDWTFIDPSGEAEAKQDICSVMASDFALAHGLTLPGDGADPQWIAQATRIRAKWLQMGAPPKGDRTQVPLYSGLVDATPNYIEGRSRGWTTLPGSEVEA